MARIDRVTITQRLNGYVRAKIEGEGFYPTFGATLNRVDAPIESQTGYAVPTGNATVRLLLPRNQVHDQNVLVLRYVDVPGRRFGSVEFQLELDEDAPKRGPGGMTQRRRGGLQTSKVGRAMALSATARR